MKTLPFIAQMEPVFDEAEASAVYRYMQSGGWVTEFKKTEEFERTLCDFTGARHCVAVNNGTIALVAALLALGVQKNDEVLVPDFTMIATANAVRLIGADPVFVDVERQSLNLDPELLERALSTRTKAVLAVSLNGRSRVLDQIKIFCERHRLVLIEDAAQSLGSAYQGRHFGTWGRAGTLSFSSQKIVTTGQGGAVLTDDEDVWQRLRGVKDFGRRRGGEDIHDSMGFNFKFTDLQAVVGIEQMKKLSGRILRKKKIYARYQEKLHRAKAIEWIPTDLSQTTPWFMDIYVDDPDGLAAFLKMRGIGSRRVYPPVHSQKAYARAGLFPVTEHYARKGLWLPSSSQLSDADVDRVCEGILEFFGKGA